MVVDRKDTSSRYGARDRLGALLRLVDCLIRDLHDNNRAVKVDLYLIISAKGGHLDRNSYVDGGREGLSPVCLLSGRTPPFAPLSRHCVPEGERYMGVIAFV